MNDPSIPHAPAPLLERIATWPEPARAACWEARALFHDVAQEAEVGRLDETLKWGQPSWRPVRPRTGSTLRMGWTPDRPDRLALFVDCKTDLAARMYDNYPQLPFNDERRELHLDLDRSLPDAALRHLAEMTFTYHRKDRRKSA